MSGHPMQMDTQADDQDWEDAGEESMIVDYTKIQDILKLTKSIAHHSNLGEAFL